MLTSLALMFLLGMALGWVFQRLHLPSLLGMLITGMLLGPYGLNLLDGSILGISADHHSYPGGALPEPGGFEAGGPPGHPDVLCARLL